MFWCCVYRNTNSQNQNSGQNSNARPLSIEASRTQSNPTNVEVLPNQPRQPSNLQGLLRFAMEATKSEDAPNESSFHAMDHEVYLNILKNYT